ncbi:HamA C-terminal domain-containing protein [Geofilum sp. OHC36d9]|uniref:HamA C-terminal domain-containing protein n=1 Tax=Geofilum sp. OHC36d9 TaxID=3458413 RepID=UPI0040338224
MSRFFNIVIHKTDSLPDLHGLCAGFENKSWRKDQLVDYLFNYLPEFALNQSELQEFDSLSLIPKIRKAAGNVYQSDKFRNRGEFGELLLHAIIRETHNTIPAISKIFYKDGPNETVKGFDAVHVVDNDTKLELWLGEVKFYQSIYSAISDVIDELNEHVKIRYVKNEFITITNKIDRNWEHAEKLIELLDPTTSLDDVFERTCIPVLLTYDSKVLASHEKKTDEYIAEIEAELLHFHNKFCKDLGDFPLTVHLFLLPLDTKKELIISLENKLKAWQQI